MLQSLHLSHLPLSYTVFVAVYRDLRNAAHIKEQLLVGNSAFEYAFIDASLVRLKSSWINTAVLISFWILSTTHVLAAAFRAINDLLNDRLRSRNVHSETVFALSPNNNIAEAFRRFGVGEETSSLIVIKVATSSEVTFDSVQEHLNAEIEGSSVAFDDDTLQLMSDTLRIRKVYKLNTNAGGGRTKVETANGIDVPELVRKELEASVLGTMALRGAT